MTPRFGLRARFALGAAVALAATAALLVGVWWQLRQSHAEFARLSREAMHASSAQDRQRHGEELVAQLAERLANPLYYYDLDRIGEQLALVLAQSDVSAVAVIDAQGRLIHDGSADIAAYGQPLMTPEAMRRLDAGGARGSLRGELLWLECPVRVGQQLLGAVRVEFSLRGLLARDAELGGLLDERLDRASRRYLAMMSGLLLALLGLSLAMYLVLARGLVGPIRRLAAAARAIGSGRHPNPLPDSDRGDEMGELIRAFGRMSRSLERQEVEMRKMALSDALTGLPNRLALRRAMDQRLQAIASRGGGLAMLFLDLDDFKRVNDTLGHDAGDRALVQLAERFKSALAGVGNGTALLARFGGDEFVALIEGEPIREAALRLANALLAETRQPVEVPPRAVMLGTSIGIAVFPHDAGDANLLLKQADIAMYQAKQAGKNCVHFFSHGMDHQVERRVRIEHDLRGAWERGEMFLHYQPIYRMHDRRLVGAEALLRWLHPDLGEIEPSAFIDVAEHSGLIEGLTEQVLRQACKDAVGWQRRSAKPISVAVNLSPRQLHGDLLPQRVTAALADSGLPAHCLHLELTETAVLGDEAHAIAILGQLRRLGVELWLDDFGTGFSGLSHLRRMPVDGVKIDRSFVADVLTDPDDLALTGAIVAMAHSRGMAVIAEGIESEGQFELLREQGCDLAQGFWLDRPLTAGQLPHRAWKSGAYGASRDAEAPAAPTHASGEG